MKRTTAAFSADSGSKKLELQKKFGVENQLWSSWRVSFHSHHRNRMKNSRPFYFAL
jgi:hypothetical protein